MIAAVLLAGSIAGSQPSPGADLQPLLVRSLGAVVLRIDADGFVQARGCDGRLHPIGEVTSAPRRLRIGEDGQVQGLAFAPGLASGERQAFDQMMRAFGYSDWNALARACVPTAGASAAQDLQGAGIGLGVEVLR